jgi:hypothetical protein
MVHVDMNWADVGAGVIFLALGVVAAVAWIFIDGRRLAAGERRNQHAFEQDMTAVELPEWNGDTYEWTPESLAYLADPDAYQAPDPTPTLEFPAVPDSTLSGPMPVMDGPLDGDAFMEQLKADNAAFLAGLEVQ